KKLPDFEIFNAGSPGNDINGYYEIVKYYLNKINPDYLFVGLFLGNDFSGPMLEQRESLKYKIIQISKNIFPNTYFFYKRNLVKKGSRYGIETLTPISKDDFKKITIQKTVNIANSRSLNIKKYYYLAENYNYDFILNKYPDLKYSKYCDVVANAIVFKDFIMESILLNNKNSIENYNKNIKLLIKLNNFIKENRKDVKIVFLLFPISFMIDEKYALFYKDLGYNLPLTNINYPLRIKLINDLKNLRYNFIDVHDFIIDDMFFREDWHFTEIGNEVVSNLIFDYIKNY
ncbi:MAG: hypothetical protein N2Z85_02640, partial [Patescibacteria group bacterium]|nr:hypothetical protein [Patescibacteria group bacterium]